jgi:RNA polymerase sigma factor (sigma-70 family)
LLDIIHGCVKAKRESQEALYKCYYGFAMSICMRYCNAKDDAVEIVNDGFLKIYKSIGSFTPTNDNAEASFMAWAKKIIVFTAIDHYRKNLKSKYVDELNNFHFAMADNSESAIDTMAYDEIIKLVQKLSPSYRTVFNLYVIDGYKHEEIAKHLNISVGTSKSNLSKARLNIQKMLQINNTKLYDERKAI